MIIQKKIDLEWEFTANYSEAPNGRIWLGCKTTNVNLVVLKSFSQLIHCHVQDRNSAFQSYITIVYRMHIIADRRPLWIN